MFTLIRGAEVYAPEELGKRDILIAGKKIVRIGKDIEEPEGFECDTIEAHGKIAYPGFIDIHIHSTGADDGQGPVGRTFDIDWRDIVESGVTTTVGVQGSSIRVNVDVDEPGVGDLPVGLNRIALEPLGFVDLFIYPDYFLPGDEDVPSSELLGSENLRPLDEGEHGLRLARRYLT